MRNKKAKKLRKELGMTKENFRQKDYGVLKEVEKVVYFRNSLGNLTPVKCKRQVIVNRNLYYYRKMKKQMNRSFYNG
jgi:hypothetical protein